MNVAMVTSWKVHCGVASYSANLADALGKLGINTYIVRLPRFGFLTQEILQNVVYSIPPNEIDIIVVSHEYGLYKGLEESFYANLKRLKKPIVSICHAIGNWGIDSIIAEASNRVIVHNRFCKRKFGYPSVIIPHGASPVKCPPKEECKKAWNVHPITAPVVGYVGFISPYKGLETLIEAMAKVPYAGLLIGGGWHVETQTDYMVKLKEWSLKLLPARCQWLGFVPDERMSTLYGAIDVLVYPSRYATESGALITALSHGKAVIASNLPPFKEKAQQGTLLTFKDVGDLQRKIKTLLSDEPLRRQYETTAFKYAEATSWSNVAKQHIELYESILNSSETPQT